MPKLLLVSQVYIPDPASVGQHIADVAEQMVSKGWEVSALTSNRGYDEPQLKFASREVLNGVKVSRLSFSSLGKKSIFHRLLGQAFFCVQSFLRAMTASRPDVILVTTSPPMGGMVGLLAGRLRGIPIVFWVMDLNPDQAIAQGIVSEKSVAARLFNLLNRSLLRQSAAVIALDRFMAGRLQQKVCLDGKLHVMPPWPMESYLGRVEHEDNPFRKKHELEGKFVFMYSGNHSVVHPLETFLEVSRAVRDDAQFKFVFVGGGKGKAAVDEMIERESPSNLISLPYQPLEEIKYSLSAADVHLVSMGEVMVGCVHPCKFYGAMALEKPVLFLGPEESHIGDILKEYSMGWQIEHGEMERAEQIVRKCGEVDDSFFRKLGLEGRGLIDEQFSKEILCGKFCNVLEAVANDSSECE